MISVRMLQDWKYPLDENGNAERRIPKDLVLELEDDVAAVAIALSVAEPMRPLSDVQQAMVDAAAAVLAGADPAEVEAAMEQQVETADGRPAQPSATNFAGMAPVSDGLTYDPPRAEPEPDPEVAAKGKGKKKVAA